MLVDVQAQAQVCRGQRATFICLGFFVVVVVVVFVVVRGQLLFVWGFFVCLFWCPDKVSLYNHPAYPGTHFVDQAGLQLTEICLPLSSKC